MLLAQCKEYFVFLQIWMLEPDFVERTERMYGSKKIKKLSQIRNMDQ